MFICYVFENIKILLNMIKLQGLKWPITKIIWVKIFYNLNYIFYYINNLL